MREVFENDVLYTSKEVCNILKIHKNTLKNWVRKRKITYTEYIGVNRFLGKDLNQIGITKKGGVDVE